MPIKDYLGTELARNKRNAALFTRMIELAYGHDDEIMIAHHLTFELNHDLNTMNEIPSADTLIFDHDAMTKIFGLKAYDVMRDLASLPVDGGLRDTALERLLNSREAPATTTAPAAGYVGF